MGLNLDLKVKKFWDLNYRKKVTTEDRIEIVRIFIKDTFNMEYDDFSTQEKYQHKKVRHPELWDKDRTSKHYLLDIMGDFIMRVNQVEERSFAEYPVKNPWKAYDSKKHEEIREVKLYLDEDISEDENGNENFWKLNEHLSAETQSKVDVTEDDLKFLIFEYKYNTEYWIKHIERKVREERKYIIKKLKGLDETRVRTCKVCFNAFYAQDKRLTVCKLIKHLTTQKYSLCQYKNNSNSYKKNA